MQRPRRGAQNKGKIESSVEPPQFQMRVKAGDSPRVEKKGMVIDMPYE
jgi:hypothetical protein